MPDYRRLISYIYEYEGKEKGKNVGFVKIEARNGQCRMNVNVKRMYMGGNAIGVYLLGRDGQKTFLGNMFVRNGNGEFRTMVDIGNVEGTGNGMDTYYGMTVHDVKNSWRSYKTIWEDAVVPDQGTEAEKGETDAETGPVAAEILPGSGNKDMVMIASGVAKEIEEELEREENAETDTQADADVDTQADAQIDTDMQTDADVQTGAEGAAGGEPAIEETVMETEPLEIPKIQEAETGSVQTPEPRMVSPELENPDVLRYLQETEGQTADPEILWQELRKAYPKIAPFDYENGCEVLTIRPEDIGRLPRENWVYGNNSFLLHGYYNFRYLILVRLNRMNDRPRFLIGIPGHYYSNEKYMATMFGFPNFVLSKKQPPNDGRFGYWYTDIKMH